MADVFPARHADSKCPSCWHLLSGHEAQPLRRLWCNECDCHATTKWRYAWAVCLLWFGQKTGSRP